MTEMFYGCKKLNKLNINNFEIRDSTRIKNIFSGCKKELKKEMKDKYKKFKDISFDEDNNDDINGNYNDSNTLTHIIFDSDSDINSF